VPPPGIGSHAQLHGLRLGRGLRPHAASNRASRLQNAAANGNHADRINAHEMRSGLMTAREDIIDRRCDGLRLAASNMSDFP
jgi:hypothetical protein